jgi:hypothetical protein
MQQVTSKRNTIARPDGRKKLSCIGSAELKLFV